MGFIVTVFPILIQYCDTTQNVRLASHFISRCQTHILGYKLWAEDISGEVYKSINPDICFFMVVNGVE